MASIFLSEPALAALKKALRKDLPHVGSSHLSEALAAALGRRSYAALRSELPGFAADPPIELLDEGRLQRRLEELGYPSDPEFCFESLEESGAIPTVDPRSGNIDYRGLRQRAWRNLMVCAINAGIEKGLYSLRPGDSRWPGADHEGTLFDFMLPNGLPARGYVSDIGYGELSVHVAVNPKDDSVCAFNAGFAAGDAMATGWLERQRGAWLQSSTTSFHCRRTLLKELTNLVVEPLGYGDRGRVIM
jgi:hypothetical protein